MGGLYHVVVGNSFHCNSSQSHQINLENQYNFKGSYNMTFPHSSLLFLNNTYLLV